MTFRRRSLRIASVAVLVALTPLALPSGFAYAGPTASAVSGLKLGSSGDAVRQLQQALIDHGAKLAGGVDGSFGAGTQAALKQFQTGAGLNSSGTVDLATEIALGLTPNAYFGLTQGSNGDAVRQLQTALINRGIAVSGGADGVFGAGTTTAVKALQRELGYLPTGSINAATAAALGNAAGAAPAAAVTAGISTTNAAPVDAPAVRGTQGFVAMKIGARGSDVTSIQQMLIDAGVAVPGGADGVFGALTANALKSFQNARGLTGNGTVDQATYDALLAAATPDSAPAAAPAGAPAPEVAAELTVGLAYGALGANVTKLQQQLLDAGVAVRGGADGVFGSATVAAVKAFQTSNSLEVTGKVDAATAAALATLKAPAVAVSPMLGLRPGALGTSVVKLQEALIKAGMSINGGADGIFGPATAAALKAFQAAQGLATSGEVDDATVAALNSPAAPVTPPAAEQAGFPIYGEQGPRVIALQSALIKAGITLRGGADGDFGSGTSSAIAEFQRLKQLSVTGRVNQATAEALGLAAAVPTATNNATAVSIEVFPVQGRCGFTDTWHDTRGGGRLHLGVDIVAPIGNLIYAVADGTITKLYADAPGSLSGNGVRLSTADGTYFFYAHMTSIADGIGLGAKVRAGQVLGTIGSTGATVTPHLHLEIHPKGGAAVNPYPIVKAVDACNVTAPRG